MRCFEVLVVEGRKADQNWCCATEFKETEASGLIRIFKRSPVSPDIKDNA